MPEQKGVTVWLTGLSGSGKTTIALEVEKQLKARGYKVQLLDGDLVREHLTSDLGFSKEDRDENIRRNSFVAKLLTDNDIITLCSFVSPYHEARQKARALIGSFIEVYVNAPLATCEERDVKGLYAKARSGEVEAFTGISDPYEPPVRAEIELRTDQKTVKQCAAQIIAYLEEKAYIQKES